MLSHYFSPAIKSTFLDDNLLLPHLPLRISAFFEEVASQTGAGAQLQHLQYLGHDLPLEAGMKVVNLPCTSPERPLTLLSHRLEANNGLPCRERKSVRDAVFLCSLHFIADAQHWRVVHPTERKCNLKCFYQMSDWFLFLLCSWDTDHPNQVWRNGRLQLHQGINLYDCTTQTFSNISFDIDRSLLSNKWPAFNPSISCRQL